MPMITTTIMISMSVKPAVSFVERPRDAATAEQGLERVNMVHLMGWFI
jgi:hypothetical protein